MDENLQSVVRLAKEDPCWERICVAICRVCGIDIFMPRSFLVEVGLCLGGGTVCRLKTWEENPAVSAGSEWWGLEQTDGDLWGASLTNTVKKDSWGISSGRHTGGRWPPKSTTGVEIPKSHYFQSNFVTEDLSSLRVLQFVSETWLFSFHAKYASNKYFWFF